MNTWALDAWSLGEPQSVMDRMAVLNAIACYENGIYYTPPVSLDGLARMFRANPHHASAMYVKRNILANRFLPNSRLSRLEFLRFTLDYLVFGNAYLHAPMSRAPLVALPAVRVRRGVEAGRYFLRKENGDTTELPRGSTVQLMCDDVNQEIYGGPEYLAALHATLLNEAATLFRRKYYLNGSHAGYILYVNDAAHSTQDIDAMRKALRDSKGPGNFRNLFLYSPNGKKDGVQLIPISEAAVKDEFIRIKEASRGDILAAHRVPPQLMGIVPSNAGGFGSIENARLVFIANEIMPLQAMFEGLNAALGETVFAFADDASHVGAAVLASAHD